jgi:hypothetical protein
MLWLYSLKLPPMSRFKMVFPCGCILIGLKYGLLEHAAGYGLAHRILLWNIEIRGKLLGI